MDNTTAINCINKLDEVLKFENVQAMVYHNYTRDVYESIDVIFIKYKAVIFSIKLVGSKYRFDVYDNNSVLNRHDIDFVVLQSKRLDTITTKVISYLVKLDSKKVL
jgi:hypothetical protein